jgi:hypothetical protein
MVVARLNYLYSFLMTKTRRHKFGSLSKITAPEYHSKKEISFLNDLPVVQLPDGEAAQKALALASRLSMNTSNCTAGEFGLKIDLTA